MQTNVSFETPENITVTYRIAGPGTRYVALFLDGLILLAGMVLLGFIVLFGALFLQSAGIGIGEFGAGALIGLVIIVTGFALIGYFALFEILMNGQTPGKRIMGIRVVNEYGFSLSAGAVLLRSIFRIIDVSVPIFWIVPVLSKKVQRFGDMVAGTIVIREDPPQLNIIREQLAQRDAASQSFSFTPNQYAQLRPLDIEAMETFIERREVLHPDHRDSLSEKIVRGVSHRIGTEAPGQAEREQFMEDLLAGYARREARQLA